MQTELGECLVRDAISPGATSVLDVVENLRGAFRMAMGDQPAWTFRDPHAHDQNDKPKRGADEEAGTPPDVLGEQRWIEQQDRATRADRSAEPEASVDDEIGVAPVTCRHEFLNGRSDRRVLTADACPGKEAEQRKAVKVPGERRGCGGNQIEGERDGEELLASEPVGEPAKIK